MGIKLKEPPKEEEVVEEPKDKKSPGKEQVNFDFNKKSTAAKENKMVRSQSQKRFDKKGSQINDEEVDDGYVEGVFLPKQPPLHEILNVSKFFFI